MSLSGILKWFREAIVYETRQDGSRGSILRYGKQRLSTYSVCFLFYRILKLLYRICLDNLYAISFGWIFPRRGSVFSFPEQIVVLGGSCLLITWIGYSSCDNSTSSMCIGSRSTQN
jgi:hypothetical protein